MKKAYTIILMLCAVAVSAFSQAIDYNKVSPNLVRIVGQNDSVTQHKIRSSHESPTVLALVSLVEGAADSVLFDKYGCRQVERIGRIYIVEIPINRIGEMSLDAEVERIEAERMPVPAMDTSPQEINATDIYSGTDLPQAYSGEGVVSAVFDCFYDFTHPAFFDSEGNSRIKYYYDFLWENEDGSLGHVIDSASELLQLKHSQNTYNQTHGTHVAGIMAGSSVDGQYRGMAPNSDIFLIDFNSERQDFQNSQHTSATAVLGFKYAFDKAAEEGKPCVVNFSSCESITLSRQRILEGEALEELVGPGRIIVAACGNSGFHTAYMEKSADMQQAGVGITNGIGSGQIIDLDIVTPGNQFVRFDFFGVRLVETKVEGSITFNTDSIKALQGDTCVLRTSVSLGDIELRITKSSYEDDRGDVFHVDGVMPNLAYLMLCGATCLLTGDSEAWMYSDLFYSPFVNIDGIPEYCTAKPGYSVSWPASLPFIVSVGATGYKPTFTDIYGELNEEMLQFAPDANGLITKFSSMGPTFDGLIKPDVVAPGMNINAAYNGFSPEFENEKKYLTYKTTVGNTDHYYMAQSGTSMAAPIVAGTIALWLEADPTLTPEDVLDVIAHSSSIPDPTLQYPNNTYGYGEIDAYKGLLYILGLDNAIPSLPAHQPKNVDFYLKDNKLYVNLSGDMSLSTIDVSIYSVNGTKVLSSDSFPIDVSALDCGIYAVELRTENKETSGSSLIRIPVR